MRELPPARIARHDPLSDIMCALANSAVAPVRAPSSIKLSLAKSTTGTFDRGVTDRTKLGEASHHVFERATPIALDGSSRTVKIDNYDFYMKE